MNLNQALAETRKLQNLLKAFGDAEDVLKQAARLEAEKSAVERRIEELRKEEDALKAELVSLQGSLEGDKKRIAKERQELSNRSSAARKKARQQIADCEAKVAKAEEQAKAAAAEHERAVKARRDELAAIDAEIEKRQKALERFKERVAAA